MGTPNAWEACHQVAGEDDYAKWPPRQEKGKISGSLNANNRKISLFWEVKVCLV